MSIKVSRLRTGQFALFHEPSGTVVVGETLEEAYARIAEEIGTPGGDEAPELPDISSLSGDAAPAGSGARLLFVLCLALLPFLWLAVLHYSLGAIVDGSLHQAKALFEAKDSGGRLAAEVDALKVSQAALEQKLAAAQAKTAPAPADLKQFRDELDALKQQLLKLTQQIATLSAAVDAADQRAGGAAQTGDALKLRVDKLEAAPKPVTN